jgi:hypothetical protein
MLHTKIPATQTTMKAIALDHFGGLETLKLQMLPVPEVDPDEVLIHVEWAGVGQWDPSSARAASSGNSTLSRSSPMCLAPMVRAPLWPWAIASRGSARRPRLRFRLPESQGRFLRRVRRSQGRRRLAHPRQSGEPAGGRDAGGRDDRASRLG